MTQREIRELNTKKEILCFTQERIGIDNSFRRCVTSEDYMTEQASQTLDAKSLVGSYVSSTGDHGKFVIVEGPLLRSMKEGKWLVCQDIDHASDVSFIKCSAYLGKTSIVEALARLSGKKLQRINLSDQTDLLDLYGAHASVEGASPGQFERKDASFLDALQKGDRVLLDELNLAPQTVLEGLNGCLDYRGTKLTALPNDTPIAGCLLLRIHTIEEVQEKSAISQMVNYNYRLAGETNNSTPFASLGPPWEFNLRDLGRWLQITSMDAKNDLQPLSPVEYIDMIYTGRFRTQSDQAISSSISFQTSRHLALPTSSPDPLSPTFARLVKTSTSLERHGTVVNTLNQLVTHVPTTTSCLTVDRERLCHSLLTNLLDFIEAAVVHIHGAHFDITYPWVKYKPAECHLSCSVDVTFPIEGLPGLLPSDKRWCSKLNHNSSIPISMDLAKSQESQIESLKSKKAPGLLTKGHSEFVTFTSQCHLEEILQSLSTFNEALSLTSNLEEISLLLNIAASLLQYGRRMALERMVGPSRDGTGLGGGQGAKVFSDEIEDDEQLEGLQGEAEDEKCDKDLDDTKEDKAFETQQDFNGELEDVKDADKSDSNADEDGDGKEGADEIDDGVGEPLDSGAVDEKFWEGGDDDGDKPEANEAELSAQENQPMPKDSDLTAKQSTAGGEQNKAQKTEDQEMNSAEENQGSEADDNMSDGEVEEDDTDQQDEGPNAEEDENDHEPPVHDNAVPMMEHVDNSEALDLPEDLELEDHHSEAGENSVQDLIMDIEDSAPKPPERCDTEVDEAGEKDNPTNPNTDMDFQPEEAPGESQPQDDSPGKAKDYQIGAGGGTEGGGALSTPAALDQIENLDQGTDSEQPQIDDQISADASKEDSVKETKPTQAVQPKSTEQVGDGTDGQAVSQQQGPTDHSDENKNETTPYDWNYRCGPDEGKDSGEERFNDDAEVEYLQTDDDDLAHQQAPGPATEEQACEGLFNMQIDDCKPEHDIPRPPVSDSAPYPVEPLQAPEKCDQSYPAQAAILGEKCGPQAANDGHMPTSHFENEPSEDEEEDDPPLSTNLKSEDGLPHDSSTSAALWRQYQQLTRRSASHLTKQLRLILEPTTATCLQGNYRARKLQLEVGEVAIAKFGGSFDILQPFEGGSGKMNNSTSPIEGFTFSQQQTNNRLAVAKAVEVSCLAQSSGNSLNREEVRSLLRKAVKDKIMFVFLILDSLHQHAGTGKTRNEKVSKNKDNHQSDSSIILMNSVSYANGPNGAMKLKMERYFDICHFDHYIILCDLEALPNVLSSTLRSSLQKVDHVKRPRNLALKTL
ncbi:hypothetical protein MJO28_013212 [Puccinia striiformis f. sp. tritici]|uniref:Uncharacterized protein n=1 Tax=Puccinia striiformis f. sp. tritici TaxID=168172 RepID=A0ACC0DZJ3_9BASI|nr:hypothetical protein MJO28_013212 [Puccinia striiformis f. sp. tritici]